MQKIAGGLDVTLAYHTILRQGGLWQDGEIILRSSEGNHLAFDMFPLRPFIFGLMAKIEGEILGDVKLLRINRGEEKGLGPTDKFQRYLLLINVMPGAILIAGAESVMLIPGDALWVIGDLALTLTNNSQDDLVVLEILAKPNTPAELV